MKSINPANNQLIREYPEMTPFEVNDIIDKSYAAFLQWNAYSFADRKEKMLLAGEILRNRKEEFARLISLEMGKRIVESRLEIDKCAWVCEYYASNAESMLNDELIESDAQKSMVIFQPIGPVLAIMPWNFPFWQVFRDVAADLTSQANHLGVTIEADIIKQKMAETNNGYGALSQNGTTYGQTNPKVYSELTTDHPVDLVRYQVAGCYMGRAPLINSGGASSGEGDLAQAVRTAVINKRAGGVGLISGRKAFQRPTAEGVELLHAIQDVYLATEVTIA